jgi:hypothetical protein
VTFNIIGSHFTNAALQVANNDASQSITVINQSQIAELKDIITELKKVQCQPELPAEKKEELGAENQPIEILAKSPKPRI